MTGYYDHIFDLSPKHTDMWRINVMVTRMFKPFNPKTNQLLSLDCILVDERRCMIYAKIPVYEIAKPLTREVYVQFSRYTRVVPSYIPLEAFPRFLFEFVEYENLKDRYNDDKYLTDVIGILTEWGPLMEKTGNNASVNSNVRNVVIRDLRENRVQVTIWGELASKFDDDIILSKNDHSVVVVFTCCKPLLTTTSSSHFLLDLELKENDPYRLSPLLPVVFTGMNKNRPVVICISDLFEKLMAGVEIDSTYILDANVVGVDLVNDWKFVQCTQCFGKANWNKDHYFCEKKCKRRVINPRQMYKLVLQVGNGCHVMDCVFFNQYARNLLGADNRYWIEDYFVMNLYGERVVIEIKVDKFNLPPECSRRFTVVKYFGDHPDYIHDSHIIPVASKANAADVNVNHVGQSDMMRRSPTDADLNGQQFCHSDTLHVSRTPNVAELNGEQFSHSHILPIPETTDVASFYGQQMECGIPTVSPISKFYDVPERSMQCDIVSKAILPNVADVVDQHMQDAIIPVSSRVTNDVDQDIHLMLWKTRMVVILLLIIFLIPYRLWQQTMLLMKFNCLSEVTDDQVAVVVDKSVLNENIDVVASKNDSINGVVDNSVIHADNAEAENIDIVSEGKDEVGSNDILNEVADEVVSDDIVFEAAANVADMDVDDVGHESEIGVSTHSYSDADEELE
ncbi:replication factor A protein 1 [Tanacetum coccineum]